MYVTGHCGLLEAADFIGEKRADYGSVVLFCIAPQLLIHNFVYFSYNLRPPLFLEILVCTPPTEMFYMYMYVHLLENACMSLRVALLMYAERYYR